MPVNNFEFRIFQPNTAVITEGHSDDTVWFVRTGSLRLLKFAAFRKVTQWDGRTKLVPVSDAEISSRRSSASAEPPALPRDGEAPIVSKLLQVRELHPGDFFGHYRSLIAGENEDILDPSQERQRSRYACHPPTDTYTALTLYHTARSLQTYAARLSPWADLTL